MQDFMVFIGFKYFFGVCSIKNISDKNLSLERLRVLLP